MRRWLAALSLIMLAGCASLHDKALNLVDDAGWQWKVIPAGTFDLATAQPAHQHSSMVWIFIEGDGRAYLSPIRAATDPTPTDPVALRLALAHPGHTAVAYLARPCQYVLPEHSRGCTKDYWTNARYAPEVIAGINLAINTIKNNAGASQIILVGYSGGGAVAVLAAARRNDVAGIVTIAANLDLAYWTTQNHLAPLTPSLDPADAAKDVASIPQVHFTGGRDRVVGINVAEAYRKHLPANAPAHIVMLPAFTHACCWVEAWPQLLMRPEMKPMEVLPPHS